MSKSVGNVVDPHELIARLRRRSAALFPAARSHLRPGRQLQRRGDRHPGQCRSRQQLRQSRPAHACRSSPRIATARCRGEGRATPADAALLDLVRDTVRERVPGPFRGAGAAARASRPGCAAVFACNQYIDAQAPWALRKTDPERMTAVLATLYEAIADLAIAIQPVIPGFGGEAARRDGRAGGGARLCRARRRGPLRAARRLRLRARRRRAPIFPRLELPAEG